MKNKKLLAIAMLSVLSISPLVGCSQNSNESTESSQAESSAQENISEPQSSQSTEEISSKRIHGVYNATIENTKFIYTFKNDGSGNILDTSDNSEISISYALNDNHLFMSSGSLEDIAVFNYSFEGSNLVLSPIGEDNTKQVLEPDAGGNFTDSTSANYTKVLGTFETTISNNKLKMTFNEDGSGSTTLNDRDSIQISFAQNNNVFFIVSPQSGEIEQETGGAMAATYTFDGKTLVLKETDGSSTTYTKVNS